MLTVGVLSYAAGVRCMRSIRMPKWYLVRGRVLPTRIIHGGRLYKAVQLLERPALKTMRCTKRCGTKIATGYGTSADRRNDSPHVFRSWHVLLSRQATISCHGSSCRGTSTRHDICPCMTYYHCMTCHPAWTGGHPMTRAFRTTRHPAM